MNTLIKGQKIKLEQLFPSLTFQVVLALPAIEGCELDTSCFGLDNEGKLSDEQFFIFYNQTNAPNDAIVMEDATHFLVDLTKLPSTITKLVFAMTIDGNCAMNALADSTLSISSGSDGATYTFSGEDFTSEKAIIMAEIYNKDSIWRVSAVGSGFFGGLDALLISFGGEPGEDDSVPEKSPTLDEIELPAATPAEEAPAAPAATPKKRRPSTKKSTKKAKEVNPVHAGFEEQVKALVKRVQAMMDTITNEEVTKSSVVMPFFQTLGFDVFNPLEFFPEYTADVGNKKGEKVDYAILINNEPIILIEVKPLNTELDRHAPQLFRYFVTTKAKFAILTNGLEYKFFTDLDKENIMDNAPFLDINLLEMTDADYQELIKFHKTNLDVKEILDSASELRYLSQLTEAIKKEITSPSDGFIRYILTQEVYDGRLTQNIIDKFRPLVKKAFADYVNILVNDKIQTALKNDSRLNDDEEVDSSSDAPEEISPDEMTSFYIIKSILAEATDTSRITCKSNRTYFGILLENKATRWICRIFLRERGSYVIIPDKKKIEKKYPINTLDEIYKLKDALLARLSDIDE